MEKKVIRGKTSLSFRIKVEKQSWEFLILSFKRISFTLSYTRMYVYIEFLKCEWTDETSDPVDNYM